MYLSGFTIETSSVLSKWRKKNEYSDYQQQWNKRQAGFNSNFSSKIATYNFKALNIVYHFRKLKTQIWPQIVIMTRTRMNDWFIIIMICLSKCICKTVHSGKIVHSKHSLTAIKAFKHLLLMANYINNL